MTDGKLPQSDQMTTEETSILHKVRSRVSDILPKWFSPSRAINPSPVQPNDNSGSGLRRRRPTEGEGDSEGELEESSTPVVKKMKITEQVVAPSSAGTSTNLKRQHISRSASITSQFTSSTPTSIEKRRKLIGSQYTNKSSPYNLSKSFNERVNQSPAENLDERDEIVLQFESPSGSSTQRNSTVLFNRDIKHRKSIHGHSIDDNKNEVTTIGNRKRLNISAFAVDRSISEPPRPSNNRGGIVFGKSQLNAGYPRAVIDEKDDELDEEISINDIDNDDERNSQANGGQATTNNVNNESVSDASSDGGFSGTAPPAMTHSELFKNRLISRHSSQSSGPNARDRLSGFMGNRNNLNLSASTGELNFSKHLETDKSLFTERNVHSAMSALNRPSFNASLYGSNSSLNSAASSNSRLFHVNSPFYLGKTMYGGAAAATSSYSRRDLNMHSALRVPVQMRPSSSLSNRSSSSHLGLPFSAAPATATSGAVESSNSVVLSSTAKRILELMNQYSSPLQDVRKIGKHLNNTTASGATNLPGLVQQRSRFNEEDLKLSRSIRLNTPKTPYSRPLALANRDQDNINLKLLSTPNTNELQVPQISQLLKMKRLQYNTEQVRQMAVSSKSVLNKDVTYRLPTDSSNALGEPTATSPEYTKHTTKIKTKITKTRPTMAETVERSNEVALPDIRLPAMKAIPNFGLPTSTPQVTTPPAFGQKVVDSRPSILAPSLSFAPPAAVQTTNHKPVVIVTSPTRTSPTSKLDSNFKFSSPLTDISKYTSSSTNSTNFKFSDPILSQTASALSANSKTNNLNGSSSIQFSKSNISFSVASQSLKQPFTFDPSTAKLKAPTAKVVESIVASTALPQLKSGSVMDFLKASSTPLATDGGFQKLLATQNSKWECASCMTRNDTSASKCLCCETAKPGAVAATTLSSGSSGLFKMPSSTNSDTGFQSIVSAQKSAKWECSACLASNDNSSDKCLCCAQAKPSTKIAPTSAPFSAPSIATPMDSGFKNLVAAQSAKWECSSCMTRNDTASVKCLCCEAPKPGAAAPAKPMDSGFKNLVASQSAKWECTACMTRNENSRTKCVCCEQAKPGASSDKVPQFSFGAPASSKFTFGVLSAVGGEEKKATTTTSALPETGGFSFGNKPSDSGSKAPAGSFSFGTSSSSAAKEVAPATSSAASATGGFSFGAAKPTAETKGFTFGATASSTNEVSAIKPATGGFSFGTATKPAATLSKDTIDTSKPEPAVTSSPLAGFKFGQTADKKDSPATGPAPVVTKPSGGFSFGSPASAAPAPSKETATSSPVSTTTAVLPSTFAFGNSPKVGGDTKPGGGFSFSTPPQPAKTASTTPTPGLLAGTFTSAKQPDSGSQFSFGSAKPSFAATTQSPTPSITPTFGSTFGEKKTEAVGTTSGGFGAVKDDASKVFGSFGGPSSSVQPSKTSLFGGPVTSVTTTTTQPQQATSASTPFVFGSGPVTSKPDTAGFSFGSNTTSSLGQTAATSLFGAATKQQSVPTFGSSQSTAGGFQSFSSFSSQPITPQPEQPFSTPTFGASANPFGNSSITPSFGSTAGGQGPASTPLNASGSLPPFGSAGGFGSGGSMFGSGGVSQNVVSSTATNNPSPFSVPNVGSNIDEPTSKKFNFGGQAAAASGSGGSFVFGNSNNNSTLNDAAKPAFNFSSTAPQPSFDFTNGTQTTPNNAFQFSASNNPFAAQPNPANQQNPPRRKIKATRRLRQ